jgi:GTP-binding protein YchF
VRAGIVGYAFAGKTALFEAVSAGSRSGDITAVAVPDSRLDRICDVVQPRKRTPTTLELVDDAARMPESGQGKASDFATAARKVDVLVHVVRAFDSPTVPFHDVPNPQRDHLALEAELLLADLQLIENRLERLAKSLDARKPGTKDYLEKVLFEKLKPLVESGHPIRKTQLTGDEDEIVRNYQLLSAKPIVVAINCAEADLRASSDFERSCGDPVFRICAEIEREIARMDEEDRAEFLHALGIDRPASEALIRAVYDALGLISFFTAGQNETKAWPLRKGASALRAAAAIHTDIARGFIRAEVVHYEDFERVGSVKGSYDQGLMKLEGKDYVVRDGDIINVRCKV